MIPVSLRPHSIRVLGLLGSFAALSCHNLDSFDTKPGDEYCGTIINTPFQAGFIPEGQPPSLELGLTLDTSKLTSEPGILRSNDASNGMCSATSQPLFQNAPLRAIPALDHDALSTLTFGEGHEHDFFAYVDSTCQGTMLAVVSLLKNNLVEVRLFKPERLPPSNPTPAETPGFAVFDMSVQKGGCADF